MPPVSNKVPPPSRPFLPVYLWGKFKMLILGDDPPMVFFPGQCRHEGSAAMKKFLKWALVVVLVVRASARFLAFLYFIPPFFITPPEHFGKAIAEAAPAVDDIADPAERAIAARGRYIVMTHRLHRLPCDQRSRRDRTTKYLAGGASEVQTPHGTYVSRNLTPDKETGLARRTDDEVKRVLRSGTFADGHVVPRAPRCRGRRSRTGPTKIATPWSSTSAISKPIAHRIPEPVPGNAITIPGAIEAGLRGQGLRHRSKSR